MEDGIRTLADWAPKPEYVPAKEPKRQPKPKRKPKERKGRKLHPHAALAQDKRREDMEREPDLKLPELDDPWGSDAQKYFDSVKKAEPTHFRAFRPTRAQREMIITAAGLGLPRSQMALLVLDHRTHLPITEKTLGQAFKDEIAIGVAKSNYYAMGNLFRHTFTAPAAAIFWAKARLQWRDRDMEEAPQPPSRENLSPLEVARRVAFVLNAAVLNVNLSAQGGSFRSEGKEMQVIEQEPG